MAQPVTAHASRPTHVRYVVLGLTVIAYMITYMDRQILAVARPVIRDELGISLVMMGWITFGFRMAYALFQVPGGWLGDTIGARKALAIVVTWWSAFTALTALAWSATSMIVIQARLGRFRLPPAHFRAGCVPRNAASRKASRTQDRAWAERLRLRLSRSRSCRSLAGALHFTRSEFWELFGPWSGSFTIAIRLKNMPA